MTRRRHSDSVIPINRNKRRMRHWSISPPSTNYFFPNNLSKINSNIWTEINTIRKFKKIYSQLPKLIIKTFYSGDEYDTRVISKKGISYFKDVISKNVFDLISMDINVFDSANNLRWSDFIRQGDIDLFDYLCIGRTVPINNNLVEGDTVGPTILEPIKHSIFNAKISLSTRIYDTTHIINRNYSLKVYSKTLNSGVSFSECKDQLIITHAQYRRLNERYNYDDSIFNQLVFLLIYRYKIIGNNNAHCSLPPRLIKQYRLSELFGSPLNTVSEQYYSPFEDEKYFGSRGNFFTSDIAPGRYLANPPYDKELVQKMIIRLIDCLSNTLGITIIINIPSAYELDNDISKNRYYREEKSLNKDCYKHYDYYSDSYIPVCSTKVILLSNKLDERLNLKTFCDEWERECY